MQKVWEMFARYFKSPYLCTRFREGNMIVTTITKNFTRRALSSAGSERLPYKQRVGGSNPSAPTSGSLAQLYRASDYGSEGYRLESYRSHIFDIIETLGGYQSGQMGQTVNLLVVTFGGSNPSPPTAARLVEVNSRIQK